MLCFTPSWNDAVVAELRNSFDLQQLAMQKQNLQSVFQPGADLQSTDRSHCNQSGKQATSVPKITISFRSSLKSTTCAH